MTTPIPAQTLKASHQEQLINSAIAASIIAERGYCSIVPGAINDARRLVGESFGKALLRTILHDGALAIPLYRLGNDAPYTWMLRPDTPRRDSEGKVIKYEYPHGVGTAFDVLPSYREALTDPSTPIWITEGAKKADALATAFQSAIVPINLNGVWGWRGRTTAGGRAALEDFESIAWEGRRVVLAFDGDFKFNAQVMAALQRLARLLIGKWKVADLQVLSLPMKMGGTKVGVDDYLAAGNTPDSLEALLTPFSTIATTGRVEVLTHPETGEKLYLPAGYDVRQATIGRPDRHGIFQPVYSGAIYVRETGEDLQTHEQTATIRWNGRGTSHGEITIPRAALTDTKAFGNLVGGAGAALHPRNIKDVAALLVEFVQENIEGLPHRAHVGRLGLVGSNLVTPAGAIGFDQPVRYVGRPTVAVGTDTDAYPTALREIASWEAPWTALLSLGLSLAAPALGRLEPRRNPVLYLAGQSGSGKTTLAQFAAGCWGDPTRSPLRVEAGRTTTAGIFQTLETLGGLPLLIDEAHTFPDPKRLELACYQFANRQSYTRGSVEGAARGGETLNGALFLAGEALPDFRHAGSRLRVLWVDTSVYPPLGAEARSEVGAQRAAHLEAAWEAGAGCFGHAVATAIWADWANFCTQVHAFEDDPALAQLGPWRLPLAAAAAALHVAFTLVQAFPSSAIADSLLAQWAAMLTAGHGETDPAVDAWERLVTLLVQGRHTNDSDSDHLGIPIPDSATWERIEADRGGGMIACRKIGEAVWSVIPSTPQFQERVGTTAVQLYGQTWLKRGWLQPGRDGKATQPTRTPNGLLRVLQVPESALSAWERENVTP